MSLLSALTDYFNDNTNIAEAAMYQDIMGGVPWKGTEYKNSKFEDWAVGYGITIEQVDQHGGEDQGSTYYTVYKFTGQGEEVYLKFEGYYQSYDGATYEGFQQVQPVTKTVTVYE